MRIEPWHWWVLGGLLVLLEVAAPGFVLIWLGLAALATGALLWLAPELAWPLQLAAFSLLALGLVGGWLGRRRRRPLAPDEPFLNRRAESYIGEVLVLVEPIRQGRGKARVGDTVWPVRGPDLPAEARVRVVGVRDGALLVEPTAALP
ncbi:MAG: NfeD family protein [Geminicoccaceae bacterium]|nr:NfeD family protein [Geminicoccaceae bacterium]